MKAIQGGGEEEQSAEESLVQAARDKPEGRCEEKGSEVLRAHSYHSSPFNAWDWRD